MRRERKILKAIWAVSLLVLTGLLLPSLSQAQDSGMLVSVGPTVQVSKQFGSDSHAEVLINAHPQDAGKLIGCSMVFSAEENKWLVVVYSSFDGGKTWLRTLKSDADKNHSDPACAYGSDGNAYFVHHAGTLSSQYYVYFNRSKDNGATWLEETQLPYLDRVYVVVDDTGGKYHGRVYVNGLSSLKSMDRGESRPAVFVYPSTNGGVTFNPPALGFSEGAHYMSGVGNCVVQSDGMLACLYTELSSLQSIESGEQSTKRDAWVKTTTSNDGGQTLSKAVTISDLASPRGFSTLCAPYLTVDRSSGPFKDRLYAVWADFHNEKTHPGAGPAAHFDIMLSYSSDKAKTWSKPIVVNSDFSAGDLSHGPDQFMPVASVNQAGVLGLMWYDRRESSNNLDWSVRFTTSLDGGDTFLPSVKISETAFTNVEDKRGWVYQAQGSGGGHKFVYQTYAGGGPLTLQVVLGPFLFSGGHTAGLAADASGVFHPFWVDSRTGIAQVWTAPITVRGEAIRNGSLELAALDDISEKVVINYSNIRFDPKTNVVALDAQIENISDDTLSGPIKLRVISLVSGGIAGGVASVHGAQNGNSGPGAVWDFTPVLIDAKLKPKQVSGVKHLQFDLLNLGPLRRAQLFPALTLPQLLEVRARALGRVDKSQ